MFVCLFFFKKMSFYVIKDVLGFHLGLPSSVIPSSPGEELEGVSCPLSPCVPPGLG